MELSARLHRGSWLSVTESHGSAAEMKGELP